MKKIPIMILGLMSLLGLVSSCDDTSKFLDTDEFLPYGYIVKDATTIQIMGTSGLVIAEMEKTDWELIVQHEGYFIGDKRIEIENNGEYPFYGDNKNSIVIRYKTNYERDPLIVAVSGLTQPYTYMGEQRNLDCFSTFVLKAEVIIEEGRNNPFYEKGKIQYSLMVEDTICVAQKSMPYSIHSMN